MAERKKFPEGSVLIIEAVIFFGVGFGGRALLDRVLSSFAVSDIAATVIRILLFLGFVLLAVYVDRVVNRYLKSRGLIE